MKLFCKPTNGFECEDGMLHGLGLILELPFMPWIGMDFQLSVPEGWHLDYLEFHVYGATVRQNHPVVEIWGAPLPRAIDSVHVSPRSRADTERELRALGWIDEEEAFGGDA